MAQVQIPTKKRPVKQPEPLLDLRTPSGKPLPY